jgi:Rieske Fe-S protein
VAVGGGQVYPDHKDVVTQPTAGDFKGFTAICTHQGCTVASVSGGRITCPCHGSQYSITDGSVLQGPARGALAPVTVSVAGTNIELG